MKYLIALLVVVLAACAAPEPAAEPTAVEPTPDAAAPDTPAEPDAPEPTVVELSAKVKELQTKAAKVNNYGFTYADLADEGRSTRTYYIRGDYVRVDLYTPAKRDANSYDTIYLNLATQETAAYCRQGNNVVCPDKTERLAEPSFSDYAFTFPTEIMANLEGGEIISSLTYEDVVADVLVANVNGREAKMYVHRFYGVPMYIEYAPEDGLGLRDFAFNNIKEADVLPPGGW